MAKIKTNESLETQHYFRNIFARSLSKIFFRLQMDCKNTKNGAVVETAALLRDEILELTKLIKNG
jgi:hypothetical protein